MMWTTHEQVLVRELMARVARRDHPEGWRTERRGEDGEHSAWPLFTKVPRRISMKMSSRRAALKRGSIKQHRPHNIDSPTRQRDESLSVPLAFGPLAPVDGSGRR